ncbi:radical SAM family heme chaperone HemW [uncultured Actinomyces sp.]|uniref:radical SAM family heme chaperone HemW n=1 Tax=uncultured Actinomyces sp. TaxID=249061 RepID=UPI002613D785|nr:radical SAM family heme chaperone HemW [uncultured Actinomyces sp.]
MSPRQPEGQAWDEYGRLRAELAEACAKRPLAIYVHVPFCQIRCGYCDFNTYTVGFGPGADRESYGQSALAEMRMGAGILSEAGMPQRPASSIFFGGGTPTLLSTDILGRLLAGVGENFGIARGAEITVEANPESVDEAALERIAKAGFTRVSFGMQSAVPEVLRVLDRRHDPAKLPGLVGAARRLGLDVSVDLIYGAPGESLTDWQTSLEEAIAMEPDHISAYALVIEEGTKMGAQVARGQLPMPDPDDEASKYEIADRLLGEAGYSWYEISNFARREVGEERIVSTQLRHASKHNLAYWRDWDWWGIGPGAHSHIGRYRWWNVKHPSAYAQRLREGLSPAHAGEILDAPTREMERILLAVRTSEGVRAPQEGEGDREAFYTALGPLASKGLIDAQAAKEGRAILTLQGRLLADYVTRELLGY